MYLLFLIIFFHSAIDYSHNVAYVEYFQKRIGRYAFCPIESRLNMMNVRSINNFTNSRGRRGVISANNTIFQDL